MRAVVVYESMFGNTEAIARAIGEGIAETLPTDVIEVGVAEAALPDVDLLVVGGPTHAFGLSRATTRRDAAERATAGVISQRYGLREWLEQFAQSPTRATEAAAFDTKTYSPRLPGSAARAVERRLRRLGYHPVCDPESFHVADVTGPLVDGELERARLWGAKLAVDHAARRPHKLA